MIGLLLTRVLRMSRSGFHSGSVALLGIMQLELGQTGVVRSRRSYVVKADLLVSLWQLSLCVAPELPFIPARDPDVSFRRICRF